MLLDDGNAKRKTGTRVTGLRGYKEVRGWECVQGECASRVRGLSRHGISRPPALPDTRSLLARERVQQTLFRARDAANGASADHQE